MGRHFMVGLAVAAALAAGTSLTPVAAESAPTSKYIVVLDDGTDPDRAAERARGKGAEVSHVYRHALHGYAAAMSARTAQRIAGEPGVVSVVADRPVSIAADTVPTGINRIDGELSPTADLDGDGSVVNIDIAVIDTGSGPHNDLNVAGGKNCSTGRSFNDGNGHGTHVAGTIAAKDDGVGVVGVAPGARIWSVRVLDNNGSGSWSSIICGVDWVTGRGDIEVANMSLGGSGSDTTKTGCTTGNALHDAICRSVNAGTTYVVAAGNSAANAQGFVPAAYDEVITVSALADFNGAPGGGAPYTCRADVDDTLADFSNYGADVDIIAPGVCILSTWKGGKFSTISGTSMASPHVAGAAALYLATHPGATAETVKAELQRAGNSGWSGDRDSIPEKLLNVASF